MRLLVATTNRGKLRDFAVAASAHDIEIAPLPGMETVPVAPETGTTFAANARAKAAYYSRLAPGEWVVADDSGLEVDSLAGAPGVRSARYAADAGVGDDAGANDNTDVWNNIVLLANLKGIPEGQRTARYRCVLAIARDQAVYTEAAGAVEGRILEAPRGTGGFGYDPLFLLPELGLTMAELDLGTKHALSHRGRAFRNLIPAALALASRT